MESLLLFLKPYLIIAFYGGHSLISVLDGLDIIKTSSFNLIDGRIISFYIAIYFILMIIIIIFQFISSFTLSNKFAITLLLVWLSPGLLQITGLVDFNYIGTPTLYVSGDINENVIGNLINSFLAVIFAWSLAILIMHILKLGQKSKVIYDHFWYISGLSALVFFILDYNTSRNQEMLEQTHKEVLEVIKVIETDLIEVEKYCTINSFKTEFKSICTWIKPAKYYINSLTFHNKITPFSQNEIVSLNALSKKIKKNVDESKVQNEIIKLNQLCGKKANKFCKEIPFEMNMDPRLQKNEVSIFQKYIIRINPVMPYLSAKWKQYNHYKKINEQDKLMKYYKWIFFMCFAMIIGVKIAFSTREIYPVINNTIYRKNLMRLLKSPWYLYKFITKC